MKNFKVFLLALLILSGGAWSCGSGSNDNPNNPALVPPPAEQSPGSILENDNTINNDDDAPVAQPEGENPAGAASPRLPANPEPELDDLGDPASEAQEGIARFAPPRIEKFRILNSVQQTQRKTQHANADVSQQGRLENGTAQTGIYYYPLGRDIASSPILDYAFSPAGSNFSGSIRVEGPVAFRLSNQQAWDYDFQHWTPAWNENAPRRTLIQISEQNLRDSGEASFRICPAMRHILATPERYYLQKAHPITFENGLDYVEFSTNTLPENECPVFRLEEIWGNLPNLYPEIRFLYVLRVLGQNGNVIEEREAELVVQFDCGKWEYSAQEEIGHLWNISSEWANNYRCIPVE